MVYSTNLPGFIVWPLMFILVALGAAMAFVPFEERTLDQWFINFIRAIYRPTKYYWRRTAHIPEYFAFVAGKQDLSPVMTSPVQRNRRSQVNAYLSSLASQPTQADDPLDIFRGDSSVYIELFQSVAPAQNVVPGPDQVAKPDLHVRTRSLGENSFSSASATAVQQQYTEQQVIGSLTIDKQEPAAGWQDLPSTTEDDSSANASANAQVTEKPLNITVAPAVTEKKLVAPTPAPQAEVKQAYSTTTESASQQTLAATQSVIFNRDLPFPNLPTQPNMLLGMIHSADGRILPNAILEILDPEGNTVRAMKTNSLGQFFISTALPDGQYRLETEAEGHTFPVYTLEVNGSVLDPVDIRARA